MSENPIDNYDDRYESADKTVSDSFTEEITEPEVTSSFTIDQEGETTAETGQLATYSSGKPRRETIKAKIIHD